MINHNEPNIEGGHGTKISIVSPVFNEEQNLISFFKELKSVLDVDNANEWELIFVDDHSSDGSDHIIQNLTETNINVRYLRFSRNEGSHVAIFAGLSYARGQCAIVMSSDLQDPPSDIPRMIEDWKKGNQIVWMVRDDTDKSSYNPTVFGKIWYSIARRLPGLETMPKTGSDMFLLDRRVLLALKATIPRRVAIPLLIRSLGFKQTTLIYQKRQRTVGKSKWTLRHKIRHIVQSIMTFTNLPLRLVAIFGLIISSLLFLYSGFIFIHKIISGSEIVGWHSIMFFMSLMFSIIFLFIGILGEYLWRIFEYSKNYSLYNIESSSDPLNTID